MLDGDDRGFPSPSEADASLAGLLGFWTQDVDQIQRLMYTSGLYRAEYDRPDYLPRTITKVLEARTEFYDWDIGMHRAMLPWQPFPVHTLPEPVRGYDIERLPLDPEFSD